ncbi:LOW QUALITY PROTEIN: ankyrin repeat domain-containing protein 60 [Morus bassanus]
MPSWPLRTFSVQLHLAEANEIFSLPRCQNDLTLKKLKSHLELLAGIALHFQQLQLDEEDLPDASTFKDNDTFPGGMITMYIWRQDGWGHLVAAAAKGETLKLARLGVTKDFAATMPRVELLGPEQKKEWVAHRAFMALFVASHRGRVETAKFILRHGEDLHSKTPLARTALHVAAVAGQRDHVELLLSHGPALGLDSEGRATASLAHPWGQKESERTMVCFQPRKRSPGAEPPAGAAQRPLQRASGPTS